MELYHAIVLMQRVSGMPGKPPERPRTSGDPAGTPLGPPGDLSGSPGDPPGTPLKPPGTPIDHTNSHISPKFTAPEAFDCCIRICLCNTSPQGLPFTALYFENRALFGRPQGPT